MSDSESEDWIVQCYKCLKQRDILRTLSCKICKKYICQKCVPRILYCQRFCMECGINLCDDCVKTCQNYDVCGMCLIGV